MSETYGAGDAQTLIENCGNTLILRCSGSENGGTSQYAARLIGDREVIRSQRSSGRDDPRRPLLLRIEAVVAAESTADCRARSVGGAGGTAAGPVGIPQDRLITGLVCSPVEALSAGGAAGVTWRFTTLGSSHSAAAPVRVAASPQVPAAYRAGERIRDERTGRVYDHTHRRDIEYKEILLPLAVQRCRRAA